MNKKLYLLGIIPLLSISLIKGQVGINTQSPTAALHIVSKGNASTTQALKVHNSNGINLLTINDDGTLSGSALSNMGSGGTGTNGKNALIKITSETAGINCITGGIKIESGLDNNGNGTLDVSEITDAKYVCNGTTGTNGADGKSILNGMVNPSASIGDNGDFYINTATKLIFGPKSGGVWPAGVSIVGPTGVTGAAGASGIGYGGTSNSAKTISLGSKTFAVQAGLAYIAGERIRFVDQTNSSNFLEGTITSYNSTSMVVNVDNNGGAGTVANWNLSVGSNLGTTGATGPAGSNGIGVPTGGTAGQILAKIDATNYNTQWITPANGGSGPTLLVRANANTAQALSFGANYAAPDPATCFGGVVTNIGNAFNPSTGIFTAPSTGLYLVTVQAVSSNNIGIFPYLDVDNDFVHNVNSTSSNDFFGVATVNAGTMSLSANNRGVLSAQVYLTAGQVLGIKFQTSTSAVQANIRTDGATNFTIVKLL